MTKDENMLFEVNTTSYREDNKLPCDEAKVIGEMSWGKTIWGVEINTLGELIGFIKKYGQIVMGYNLNYIAFDENTNKKDYLSIEIYDTYRE